MVGTKRSGGSWPASRRSRAERATGTRPAGWRYLFAALFAVVLTLGMSASPAAAATPAWPLVSSGAQGPSATTIQYLLRQSGSTISADGFFGPQTQAAVMAFQTAHGLSADGIVGPLTWSALVVPLDVGSGGEAVRALQTQLNRYGYGLAVDGSFGGATSTAVTDFKADNALGSGTAVTATVWQWLVGGFPGAGTYALPLDHNALPRSEYDDPHHDYPAIDLPVGTGTSAYAMAAGTIITVDNSACGTGIQVKDANNIIFMFCHLSQRLVSAGATVSPGQLIARTGNTGNTTGPHLHIEIRTPINRCPQPFLLALYDGVTPPNPASLPTTGCFTAGFAGQPELD